MDEPQHGVHMARWAVTVLRAGACPGHNGGMKLLPIAVMSGLVTACALASLPAAPDGGDAPPPVEREFRGVWLATVANLDWPSRPGLPADSQQAELARMFDRARELRLNAVILQVRPAADALYPSSIEPWSEYLTGEQGRPPEPYYDPLAFAVEQAHARGLELHAWFNPYRAWAPSATGPAAATHISRAQPELVRSYGSYLWRYPGEPAVRQRSIDVIRDVVERYDIDGVHLDDYFYPYREVDADGREIDFPDSVSYARYRAAGGTLGRSDWRRANVDDFIADMYDVVKRTKPWVKVGISPIGTWRPNVAPQIGGFDAYESIYADARKWLWEGTLDYFVPQLYWPIARTDMSFPVLLDWWARQNPLGRGLYPGMITGNVNLAPGPRAGWRADEILGQIYIARGYPGVDGHVHFRMGSLMDHVPAPSADIDSIRAREVALQARRDTLVMRLRDETYARPALVPLMPWLDDASPPTPRARMRSARLVIEPSPGEAAFLWVVQSRWPDGWRTEIVPAHIHEWTVGSSYGLTGVPEQVRLSAVDRTGNRSVAAAVR
ncbi:hypothetical protein BH23GEM10_BH23GEM10_12760 [soil metagenome]